MTKQMDEQFVAFVREHKRNVYLLAYSYVKNEQDALDVVQDSIQKAWNALHKLRDTTQLKSWFYQIVVRTAIDFLRKHKRIHVMDDEKLVYFSDVQEDTYGDLDVQQAIVATYQLQRSQRQLCHQSQ